MACSSPLRGLAAAFCIALSLGAQDRIALPHGTGSLGALPGWTAVAGGGPPATPAAPALAEPARALLDGVFATLRERQREAEHVLVHAPGSRPGELRLVNCYSSPDPTRSQDLQDAAFVDRLRAALEQNLTSPGVTVKCLGSRQPGLFPVGSLALEFAVVADGLELRVEHHVVPAGDRTQNFETTWFPNDVDARGEIEAVLRTFDGAREGAPDHTLRNMLLGGAIGGILGVITARRRRRRQLADDPAHAGR